MDAKYCGFNGNVVSGTSDKYNETFTFDKMGNFNSLTRNENGAAINNLSFTYIGNQMSKVDNLISPAPFIPYGSEAFKDSLNAGPEYTYDKNGSTVSDLNTGISTIQYNLLNLPDQIQFPEGHKNLYTYDASGKKLEAVNYTVNNIVNVPIGTISTLPASSSDYTKLTTDYVGNMIYENGSLKEILLPDGYWQNGVYYYYLKDHLGDTRVVINNSGAVIERSHYYPSGMRFYPESTSNSAALPYRYNGKEMEAMNGLNQYDFGARRRGTGLPVWTARDPLAEKHYNISPYVYCANNPINLIDPDGMDWYKDKDGTNQYNPDLNKDNQKDILGKDQSYVGETYQVKDDDGNVTTDYRKDGSIIYTDETDAYNRMWSQAHDHYKNQKEVGGATLKNGDVLVLPDYKNDNSTTKYDEYGYSIGKGKITDSEGNTFKITGFVHTHQDPKAGDATPSYYTGDGYGDLGISRQMGGLPIMTIGYDGYIHAAFDANVNVRITNATIDMNGLTRRSLLNGTNLTPWLNTYPTKKTITYEIWKYNKN